MTARKQAKKARAEERRRDRRETERRRDFGAAGVSHDPRTAAGQREIEVRAVRGLPVKRASVVDAGSLIKRQSERTEPRIKAITAFDDLCHRAYAGLYPEPKFERGVDVSHVPGVLHARSDAMGEMRRLSQRIGEDAQAILHLRIFERQSFSWMAQQGIGDERSISALFLAAVDAVARFYGYCGPSPAIKAMERGLLHA